MAGCEACLLGKYSWLLPSECDRGRGVRSAPRRTTLGRPGRDPPPRQAAGRPLNLPSGENATVPRAPALGTVSFGRTNLPWKKDMSRPGPLLPRPVLRETRAELAAARERARVRVISTTRCSQWRRTAFAKSPSPYPLPEYPESTGRGNDTCRERRSRTHSRHPVG